MMLKWAAAAGLSAILLSGCSLLDQANDTLTYANDISGFLDETQQFASDIPALLENAASNPNLMEDAQEKLENMQQEIDQVQQMEAPVIAESVHEKLLDYSAQLESGLNEVNSKLENGTLDPAALLENTELLKTIQELQELRNNIEKLGQ
ncbi:coiled-coil domain-containing protein 22 [Domibacillus sp. PGB-M46]|uniref:DUF6376 family protein n=1 Tax=Domibacillus sp. PGB-M46 TaxID=2910255 RepID=UPI001F571D15|nr:DUF6376 family protein [Domibacillus sp. PGB-M46]MCI2254922.1 coiled-coil domain-containing protein 22 [Domibacillus sp. PGB-M46]